MVDLPAAREIAVLQRRAYYQSVPPEQVPVRAEGFGSGVGHVSPTDYHQH